MDDREVPTRDSENRLIYSGYEGPDVFGIETRPTKEGLQNFWRWFGKSKIVGGGRRPLVMYHGTARDITNFVPKQAGSVFITRSPKFAEEFSLYSRGYMTINFTDFMSDQQILDVLNKTLLKASAFTPKTWDKVAKIRADVRADVNANRAIRASAISDLKKIAAKGESSFFVNNIDIYLPTGPNLIPVYVKAENPFDYNNFDHIKRVLKKVKEISPIDLTDDDIVLLQKGDWVTIEGSEGNSPILDAIRQLGFDSMYVEESGEKNLAVFNPNQVKSAIGNNGEFGPTPRISESRVRNPQIDTPEFKRFFDESKVVDKNGNPLIMYHGAKEEIKDGIFRMLNGMLGTGAYFTSDPKEAEFYTSNAAWKTKPNIVPAYISIKNPYFAKDKWDKGASKAKENGHDGVILMAPNGEIEWAIPFSNTQIKSAVGNIGTFDITKPSISESRRSASEAFESKLIEDMRVPNFKSREKLIEMNIDDFLSLAKSGYMSAKAKDISDFSKEGKKFNSLPFLQVSLNKEGVFKVVGHEGRHRARFLKDAGYQSMPVILRTLDPNSIRWSEQNNPTKFDYVDNWPTRIEAEEGSFSIPMPVSREQSMAPYGMQPRIRESLQPTYSQVGDRLVGPVVSTRVPTAKPRGKKAAPVESATDTRLQIGLETFQQDPTLIKKAADLIVTYPNLKSVDRNLPPDQIVERFVDHIKNNLLWLYDNVPSEIRNRSRLWYVGANRIANYLSDLYGISPDQAAAVLAVNSPQTEWFTNVTRGERLIDIWFNQQDFKWSPEMEATANNIFAKPQYQEDLNAIRGKSLEDIKGSPEEKLIRQAMWIRTYDQSHNLRNFRIITPEGSFGEFVMTDKGNPAIAAWANLDHIAKSISILESGSPVNISNRLGNAHKVRSFYNNIIAPEDTVGDVTIDTHAVAAGLLRPLSGNSIEVAHNLGAGVGNALGGIKGLYGIYAEAYRRAAAERDVLPREMQSITWEAIRGTFTDVFKRSQKANVIENAWRRYRDGQLSDNEIRDIVIQESGGINEPDWWQSNRNAPEETWSSTYGGKLSPFRVSGRGASPRTGRIDTRSARRDRGGSPPAEQRLKISESRTRPKEQLDRAVKKAEENIAKAPTGAIPLYNLNATPEALYVAQNPEAGEKLDANDFIRHSRQNQPQYSPGIDQILDKLAVDPPNQTPGQTVIQTMQMPRFRDFIDKLRQQFIFNYSRLEYYNQRHPSLLQNTADVSSLVGAEMADRHRAISAAAVTDGVPVYRNGVTKVEKFIHNGREYKGLIDVMAPLYSNPYGNLERLAQSYAIALRGRRLTAEGKLAPGDPADLPRLEAEVARFTNPNTGDPIIKEWYDAWQAYNAYVVQFLRDTGMIDNAGAQLWLQQSDYIPFYRETRGGTIAHPKIFGGLTSTTHMKAVGKSSEAINLPLLDSILTNLDAAIGMGMRNVAQQRIVRDMITIGMGRMARPNEPLEGLMTVTFKVQGKKYTAILEDPLIFESMQALPDMGAAGILESVFRVPATVLRELITREFGYMIANMLRDTASAALTTGANIIPVYDTVKNFADGLDNLRRFGVVGGYDFARDPQNMTAYLAEQAKKRGHKIPTELGKLDKIAQSKYMFPFKWAWDALGQVTDKAEASTRNAVYEDTLKRTGNEAEAVYQALSVINYGRRGRNPSLRALTAAVPFLNARIQGLDKLYQAGTGQVGAFRDRRKNFARFVMRAGLMVGLTGLYYALVSDDDEYKNANPETIDNYYILPTPMDFAVKIPIPFEVGLLFKTLPERILRRYHDVDTERDTAQSLRRAVTSTLAFNPVPQAVLPIAEVIANYDTFTGRSVVPPYMDERMAAEYQTRFGTNELARMLGEATEYSPIKIDHLLNGYFGTLGTYTLDAIDHVMRDADRMYPSRDPYEYPFVRRFFADANQPGLQTQYYDLYKEVGKVTNTIRQLRKDGRVDELNAYIMENQNILGVKTSVDHLAKVMERYRDQKDAILKSPLEPEVKKELIDQMDSDINKALQVIPILKQAAFND